MANWTQIVGTGGEGEVATAPGDLVFEVAAGEYLTLQHHYINSTDNTVDSQAVIDLFFAEPGAVYTPSHAIAFVNTELDLPPGPSTMDFSCTCIKTSKRG
jgi:hypothetical protein